MCIPARLAGWARLWPLGLLAMLCGCGSQVQLLGAWGQYMFSAQDVLVLPGEQVQLRSCLEGGDLLSDQPGYLVRYRLGPRVLAVAQTDEEGYATAAFTPRAPGDYHIVAQVVPMGFAPGTAPPPADLLVSCRPADTPILVVDLDKTVVASDFRRVLLGEAQAMPGADEVLRRLAREYTIVYLSQRPEFFGPSSKRWLGEHGFPRSVVILGQPRDLLGDSAKYKAAALARLKQRFTALRASVDDRPEDAHVYAQAGLHAILLLGPNLGGDRAHLEQLADRLAQLPPDVEVVQDWPQVRQALLEGRRFPPAQAAQRVRELARAAPASLPAAPEAAP